MIYRFIIVMMAILTLPLCIEANVTPFLVKDIHPGAEPSAPASLTSAAGYLFFRADDGVHGLELWKSNGTAAGTQLVADIQPGPGHAVPGALTDVNGALFFRADDGVHGAELWKSDGTAAGTHLVADLNPGPEGSFPAELTNMHGMLYFQAHDGRHGTELWRSDGTASGTQPLAGFNPFRQHDQVNDFELWSGIVTPRRADLVLDIHPGTGSSFPHAFVQRHGRP